MIGFGYKSIGIGLVTAGCTKSRWKPFQTGRTESVLPRPIRDHDQLHSYFNSSIDMEVGEHFAIVDARLRTTELAELALHRH